MKLMDRLKRKILLKRDMEILDRNEPVYLERTYAGSHQLDAGAWSAVIRSESNPVFCIGIYGPASNKLKYPLLVIDNEGPIMSDMVLYEVSKCEDCPNWWSSAKRCKSNSPSECPLRQDNTIVRVLKGKK